MSTPLLPRLTVTQPPKTPTSCTVPHISLPYGHHCSAARPQDRGISMALTPSRAARPRVLRASTFVSLAHAQMHSETHCQTVLQDRGISTAIASAPMLLEIALLRTCRAPCGQLATLLRCLTGRQCQDSIVACDDFGRRQAPPQQQDLLGPDLHGARTRSVSYAINFRKDSASFKLLFIQVL